ncbi:carbohydrate ABC transporter permease [Neptunomonas antarctica]|uniref:Carbohydrate ABC transporter membrane protein 2, CUT1 family n=1 Tax=Neptunomonas antarctica TaxID=619304 RepID=A0A1N7NHQ3_9GAMM|nr:carbohydrate ABC transporter permease [Neptunomonas antarctica]SIS97791.1 carbohydrate ABC transporter membrane protein 2, CUT1 family [Neptunomonas antarctica]
MQNQVTFLSCLFNSLSIRLSNGLSTLAAWLLGLFWIFPLIYALWAAFHTPEYAAHFALDAPLTLENFRTAWVQAPFMRYMLNTVVITLLILVFQLVLCTLAGYALARINFRGRGVVFALILIQLMVVPEILIVENYQTLASLHSIDTYIGVGLPYLASAFGIFLLRQTFKTIPQALEDAAKIEGCSILQIIWNVYVPLAKPTYLAFSLVSISYHWNNFLWPLVVTNTEQSRPLTVGMAIFGAPESGVDWSVISAGTLISVAPLLIVFLLFQRQFIQSFMTAGVK